MPKGFHFGRTQTRTYTGERKRIYAITFKQLLESPIGNYEINGTGFNDEHCKFKLIQSDKWHRVMVFTIKGRDIPVPLQTDNSSVSNKLYLVCPCCVKQRQHLYVLHDAYVCRECANLHYPSQSERKPERLARKIRKERINIWGNNWPDRYNLFEHSHYWPKPKKIHQTTFTKKRHKLAQLEAEYWEISRVQMEKILGII